MEAGELMGIKILDHVIIAGERYLSMLKEDTLEFSWLKDGE